MYGLLMVLVDLLVSQFLQVLFMEQSFFLYDIQISSLFQNFRKKKIVQFGL